MKFRRSDGVMFEADPGSASAKMMTKDGGFELLEDDGKVDFPLTDIGTDPIQTKAKSKKGKVE